MKPNRAPKSTNARRQATSMIMMGVPFYINSQKVNCITSQISWAYNLNPKLRQLFLPLPFDMDRRARPSVAVGVLPNKAFQLRHLLVRQRPEFDASPPHGCGIGGGIIRHLAIRNSLDRDPV